MKRHMFAKQEKRYHTDNPVKQKQGRPNHTGLPDSLKSGIEALSGYNMDSVRVYYNSSKPAQLQSLAYTKGTDIHVAPGQEKHLGHEAWHVVQQMQGRVYPTTQLHNTAVNDDPVLEREASFMGEKASQTKWANSQNTLTKKESFDTAIQRFTDRNGKTYQTLGEYYHSLQDSQSKNDILLKSYFDVLFQTPKANFFENLDINNCNSLSDIKAIIAQNIEDICWDIAHTIFDRFKNDTHFITNMNDATTILSSKMQRESIIQDSVARLFITHYFEHNIDIFTAFIMHENMDRPPEPENPEDEENQIDPEDITSTFQSSKSCVITALFHVESTRIQALFHANTVEQFHNVLVKHFSTNKYNSDSDSTPHQINAVWKNYSDDCVYPSLYGHFGYTSRPIESNLHLNSFLANYNLSGYKGMLSLPGHMIYFDYTDGKQIIGDNDNGQNALRANQNKTVLALYCTSLPPRQTNTQSRRR